MSNCPLLFGFLFLLFYNTPTTMGICVHINKSFPFPPNYLNLTVHLNLIPCLKPPPLNLDCRSILGQGDPWRHRCTQLSCSGNGSLSSSWAPAPDLQPSSGNLTSCGVILRQYLPQPRPGSAQCSQGDGESACVHFGRRWKRGDCFHRKCFLIDKTYDNISQKGHCTG